MSASAVRSRQVSPVNSPHSDAVARSGSARLPRNVKLLAWSKPLTRSAKPSASEICANERSAAPPAIFQLECGEWRRRPFVGADFGRSEEHTSELQSLRHLVCRLLLDKKNTQIYTAVPLP